MTMGITMAGLMYSKYHGVIHEGSSHTFKPEAAEVAEILYRFIFRPDPVYSSYILANLK